MKEGWTEVKKKKKRNNSKGKKTFPPQRVALRSQHQLVRRVVEGDLDRVAQTRQFMQIYKLVGFEHYRHSAER